MSREIKFRAFLPKGYKGLIGDQMLEVDQLSIFKDQICEIFIDGSYIRIPSDYVILMQYTGLKDKNGIEIYEGDILRHDLWGNSQIIWEHGMFRGTGEKHDVTLADHQLKRSRVVGNIYENPTLLEQENHWY